MRPLSGLGRMQTLARMWLAHASAVSPPAPQAWAVRMQVCIGTARNSTPVLCSFTGPMELLGMDSNPVELCDPCCGHTFFTDAATSPNVHLHNPTRCEWTEWTLAHATLQRSEACVVEMRRWRRHFSSMFRTTARKYEFFTSNGPSSRQPKRAWEHG